jgi:hypothetical protein
VQLGFDIRRHFADVARHLAQQQIPQGLFLCEFQVVFLQHNFLDLPLVDLTFLRPQAESLQFSHRFHNCRVSF